MSELSATNCGCDNSPTTCGNGCGISSCLWILILLFCCGCGNSGNNNYYGHSGDCGGGCDCIWIILLLLFCGNGNGFGCGC